MSYRSMGADFLGGEAKNASDATAPNSLITLQQATNLINGQSWKSQPVRVATTAAGTLSSSFAAGQVVDGVTLVAGDRILLKNQAAGAENGIYTVNASGAPTRATDADSSAELYSAAVLVAAGTTNADRAFTQTTDLPITVGTTALVWAQLPGAGATYLAGNGLALSGSTFAVNPGSGIIADGTSTRIDPAYAGLAKRYSADLGAASAGTAVVITHNLGTLDVVWQIRRVSDGVLIDMPDTARDANSVTVTPPSAITSGQYRFTAVA